ncbi:hypothetical protein HY385_02580 [Candidatus Daviesbacteria bacterium]|nr:hypothetical protein [Candidatus Daviesbacteria bacterium]
MKYDSVLNDLKQLLPSTQSILIALPKNSDVDTLAAGLALYLSLTQASKDVKIVTEEVIKVSHTNLFGVDKIQSSLPPSSGGDFVITLGGVATADGKVPTAEKMDYYTTGNDLNLVVRVLPGQKFEPTSVTPHYEGSGSGLIFVLGVQNLDSLGAIYSSNPQLFTSGQIINLDNKAGNSQFGKTNILDTQASSISEMVGQILPSLSLPIQGDIATNLLTGIFSATNNLQSSGVGADTYEVVAQAVRAGGQKPVSTTNSISPGLPSEASAKEGFDLSKIFQAPVNLQPDISEAFPVPPVVSSQPSPEEAPRGEGVETANPEADWLTPKIFKGKSGLG